jgi:hypothetical protein
MEVDVYEGMFLPAGSFVSGNIWCPKLIRASPSYTRLLTFDQGSFFTIRMFIKTSRISIPDDFWRTGSYFSMPDFQVCSIWIWSQPQVCPSGKRAQLLNVIYQYTRLSHRICPGRHLALEHLFFNIACILTTFDVEKAIDEHGKPIVPKRVVLKGLI